ncbi:MAG: hypothetical protein NTV34_20555, partial [Proteobacteria bacterium]|nr:hypothetical protein [Pseudomonadota bacterium]
MPTPTSKRTEHRFEAGAAVGWTLRTGITDSVLKIYLDDHVVLGTPPSTWLADLSHASIRGFCGKAYRYLKCVSIYEFEVSTAALVIGNFRYTAKPEDVRALCKLIESDSRLSLKFSWDPQKRCWNAMKLVRNDSNNEQAIEPTLHAMESRALASHIEHFDRSLIDRKNDLPELEINNLALQTRRWIRSMSLRDQNDQDTPTTDFSEQNATDNITTLSGKLKFSIDNKSWSEAIKALGSITGKIEIAFGNPAEIPTLALVLPELAGDILRHFDQKTAIIAYERVLLSKNAPRVLQKICQAAKGSSNALEEIHLLERWLQVEKRKPQIQEILEELAALHIKQQDYVSALRKIESLVQLRYTPNLAWAETIQLAATYEHAKRALLILEKMEKLISSAKNGVSDHVSIAISNTIAHIWAKVLNRPDLASDRLLRVVRDQKFSTQKELEEAEKSLEKSGHIEIVEKSRETRWSEMKIQERKTSQALGQRVFEHYGLSRNIKMQFQTAYELIEAGHRAPNLAQTLPAWMSENLPWRKLIDACLQQLEKPTFDRTI